MTEKITGTQFGLLLFSIVFSTIILSVPGVMVAFAKQNAWLSVFPAALTGLISIWVMTILANRYPGLSIIQYSSKIIGKWSGICLGIYLSYFLYTFISVLASQHVGFIRTFLLPNSPSLVVILTIMILCGLAVFSGVEVIGRCNEFLAPLLIVFLVPLFMLAIRDSDPGQLKPLLGEGILPVLKGAVVPSGWMSQFFFMGWLLPFLNQPKKAGKIALIALFSITFLIMVIDLLTIMILGPITNKLNFSFLGVTQYIGIEGSFERLEAIAVSMWMMGIFVKLSICLFMLCLSISQVFGIQNYRAIISPVTLLIIVGSFWIFENSAEYTNFFIFTYPSLGFFTQNLLPLALLIIDTIKRRVNKSLL